MNPPVYEWTEDNAQQFVVAVMRVFYMFVQLKHERAEVLKQAHTKAEAKKTKSQAQYDLAFAEALRSILLTDKYRGLGQERLGDFELQNQVLNSTSLTFAEPVATIKTWTPSASKPSATTVLQEPVATIKERIQAPTSAQKAADPNDRSKWSVEDWERAGVAFKPAATRVAHIAGQTPLEKPTAEETAVRRPHVAPEYATRVDDAPWGTGAMNLARWVYSKTEPGKKQSTLRVEALAHAISVLYYAELMKEGSVVPIGMGYGKSDTGKRSS